MPAIMTRKGTGLAFLEANAAVMRIYDKVYGIL